MHFGGIHAGHALVTFLLFLVLIDPLGPVDLDVLALGGSLGEPGPEGRGVVLFLQDDEQVEAGLGPLGLGGVDLPEQLVVELVLVLVADALEGDRILGQVDLLLFDVPQPHLDEDSVLALRPLYNRNPTNQATRTSSW